MVLDFNKVEDIEDFYNNNPRCDLYSAIQPVLDGMQVPLEPAEPIQTTNENLYLLGGSILLAESDTQIAVALGTGDTIPALRNIPGSFGALLRMTAESHEYDYVLIDLSPSVGALNQSLFMASDYFIIPTFPDFFCDQAVRSLATVVPKWNQTIAGFRDETLLYPVPEKPPVFMGIVSQKYRPRSGAPARSFQTWIDRIIETVNTQLVPSLAPLSMVVKNNKLKKCSAKPLDFNLANIPDFNSLIAKSQNHNVPVFALTAEQIDQQGVILQSMEQNRDKFHEIFSTLASDVVVLAK